MYNLAIVARVYFHAEMVHATYEHGHSHAATISEQDLLEHVLDEYDVVDSCAAGLSLLNPGKGSS